MNMEDFDDLNDDDVEEPHSSISLESNVDLLLADVSQVQKILNCNNIGQYVDVNEIYEKLEELTYIIREERIEYVATQLLYKFGVIADIHAEHAFNIELGDSENTSSSNQNGIDASSNRESFKNNSHFHNERTVYCGDTFETINDTSTGKPHSIGHDCNLEKNSAHLKAKEDIGTGGGGSGDETFSYFKSGCQSVNSLQDVACAFINQDKSEEDPSICAVDHINTGLNNYILAGVADDNDKNHSNSVELFGQEIMEEAKFISEMFPHFELEQILEFLSVNRDVENRIEVVSEEILKLQESMLQENTEMSELIEMKNKDICNDCSDSSEEWKDSKVSQEELCDLTSDLFVIEENANLACIATEDKHIENKNEKQLGNCELNSVSEVGNNLLALNDIDLLFIQGNSTIDEQRHINCNITSNADTENPLLFELTTPLPESFALTSQLVNVRKEVTSPSLHLVLSTVCDLEDSVLSSNSQLNNVVQQSVSLASHVSADLVSSISKPATALHEGTRPNISDRIEQSTSDTSSISQISTIDEMEGPTSDIVNVSTKLISSVSELANPQNQINNAVSEIEGPTSNVANISFESVSLVSKLTSRQPKETLSVSQLNCAVPEIERSTSIVANISCELIPSVSKLASPQLKERESTSQLICAVSEIERPTSNIANVSSESVSLVSKLTNRLPKDTWSVSQLNCAIPEIERSSSNIASVSSELMPSVSELVSPQPKETESTSQLNCAVPEIERLASNAVNVSSELVPLSSKLANPQTKEASSTSQLYGALSSSDLGIVSCGLMPLISELSSSSQEVTQLNNVQNELSGVSTFEQLNPPSEVIPSISHTMESLNNPLIVAAPSTSQLQNQGCRKKEITYEEFVSSLPHIDMVLLKEIWEQIGNNYNAVKEFITQQSEDVPDDNHYHFLLSMFPQADPKFLQETSLIIGTDEVALKDFIDEQLREDESKVRYHMLLAMFPKVESTFLHEKCIEVGNDDEAMRNLIVELLNMSESDDNYHTLLTMFPESDPAFLREKADKIGNDDEAMKKFVTEYLEEVECVQFNSLVAVLPDADPEYLQNIYDRLGNNEESIKLFIMEALETKNYPTRESYLKRKEISTLKRKYKEELNIQEFLDVIPDPWTHFRNKRTRNENERKHALSYLESHFKTIALEQINSCFQNNNYNFTLTCEQLEKWRGPFQQINETFQHAISDTEDIPVPFLQEVAFIENKTKMEVFLKRKEQERKEAFKLAKANGELLECQCCFDNELMDVDVSTCAEGHIFCKECIKRSAEVTIGNGNTRFSCLTDCMAEFSLRVIQTVLNPTTFSRMLQRRQLEEVQAAGIQDLENCPFCEFATIPATNSKVFTCLNPDCMRDSCRKCKRASHIPLRCDEVESKEIKVRTMIEDRMTEALVRTCWKCKKKFIKESGCNKMTCGCGAMMCYLCRQPVKDYNHFNGQGGTEFEKCPLYSDLQVIHDVAVQEEGIKAKKEVQAQNPDIELKHDPTEMKLL